MTGREDVRERVSRALTRHALRCRGCEMCDAQAEVVVALIAQIVEETVNGPEGRPPA